MPAPPCPGRKRAQSRERHERGATHRRTQPEARCRGGNTQGKRAADRKCRCRRDRRLHRPCAVGLGQAELVTRVRTDGIVLHQLMGDLLRQSLIEAPLHIYPGERLRATSPGHCSDAAAANTQTPAMPPNRLSMNASTGVRACNLCDAARVWMNEAARLASSGPTCYDPMFPEGGKRQCGRSRCWFVPCPTRATIFSRDRSRPCRTTSAGRVRPPQLAMR